MPQFRLPNSSGGIAWRSRRKIHASAALISLRLSAAFTPFSLSFFINKNNSSGNSSIRGFRIFKNFFLQPQQRRHRHIGLRRKQQQTNNNIPRHRRNILLFPLALGPSEVSSLESKYHAQVLDKDDISSHLEQIRNLDLINETKSSSSTVLSHTLHTTWRHIQLILRAVKISIIFTPAIITFPIWYLSNRRQLLTSNYTGAAYKPTIDSSSFSDHPGKHNHRHDWWIHLLVMSIEQAGASFIKIGQWASSRRDLFPASICTALGKLQDRVQAHSIKDTQDAVLAAFGLPINQVFSKFNYEPVGVGAIAQVHFAEIRLPSNSAIKCAVKILHPNVERDISLDLSIMHGLARFLEICIPSVKWLSLPEEVHFFSQAMLQQLDLRHEAKNLAAFNENFGLVNRHISSLFQHQPPSAPPLSSSPNSSSYDLERIFKLDHNSPIFFPKPLPGYVKERVLVETFFDSALPMSTFLKKGPTVFSNTLANIGINGFLKMLIHDNHVHSDLHPGNVFVTFVKQPVIKAISSCLFENHYPHNHLHDEEQSEMIDNETIARLAAIDDEDEWQRATRSLEQENYTPKLILLDAGLVCSLTKKNLSNLLDLLVAVSSHNGQRVAQLMVLRSQSPETVINQDLFETKMDVFLRNVRQTKATIGSVRVSEILSTLFKMVRDHHIRLEGEFVNIAVSMMLIEGMGKQFMDRQIDLLDRIPPFLAKANGLPLELLSKMANSKRQKMGTEPSGFMENFRMSLLI